jgi:hypothetical protein
MQRERERERERERSGMPQKETGTRWPRAAVLGFALSLSALTKRRKEDFLRPPFFPISSGSTRTLSIILIDSICQRGGERERERERERETRSLGLLLFSPLRAAGFSLPADLPQTTASTYYQASKLQEGLESSCRARLEGSALEGCPGLFVFLPSWREARDEASEDEDLKESLRTEWFKQLLKKESSAFIIPPN